jgi:arginine decarboxylase
MVPGQVITRETVTFMRKLDVKEIHGYNATRGLKLIKLSAIPAASGREHGKSASATAAKARTSGKKG